MHEKLALKLKELIEKKKISVQGLEKKAGLKVNGVRNILTGHSKKPSAEAVLAIAKALECSISDLLDENLPDRAWAKNVVFSRHELLCEVTRCIIKAYGVKKIDLSVKDLLPLTQEIYTYSLENNKGTLDEKFAKWILGKKLA